MQITIYTDGACDLHAENRPGGWAAILCATDERGNVLKKTVISGGQEMTTNNQMELTAVIEGLKRLQRPSDITIVTDSQYVIDIATGAKRAAKNRALWRKYFKFARIHNVTWRYVMGHSGNVYNERCDQLAVAERRKYALYRVETPQTFEPDDADIKVYPASTRSTKYSRSAWSACILRGDNVETLSDVLSNNENYYEALLIGVIQILKKLSTDETIAVYIARANFVRSINEWMPRWIENAWTTHNAEGEAIPIKYKHHWQEILRLTQERTVKFEYDQLLRHHPLYERAQHHVKGLVKNSKWVEALPAFEPVDADIAVYLASTRSAWSACIMRGSNVETLGDVLSNNETYYETLLIGVIQTLKKLSTDETIAVYITQPSLATSINEQLPRWIENDWTTYNVEGEAIPVKHKHHWQEFLGLTQERTVKFEYDQLLRHHPLYERAQHHAQGLIKNSKGVEALPAFEPVDADIEVYLARTSSTKYSRSVWSACIMRGSDIETLGDVLSNNETYYEALLIGVIQTLKKLSTDETIAVYTTRIDFATSINERLPRWIENDWITYNTEGEAIPVKHKHHWQELLGLTQERTVTFKYDQLLPDHPFYKRAQRHAKQLMKNSK